jgi:hypothetical protein
VRKSRAKSAPTSKRAKTADGQGPSQVISITDE